MRGTYVCPDVVVCNTPEFEEKQCDTLQSLTVLIEVLSDSAANYDRGTKFKHDR